MTGFFVHPQKHNPLYPKKQITPKPETVPLNKHFLTCVNTRIVDSTRKRAKNTSPRARFLSKRRPLKRWMCFVLFLDREQSYGNALSHTAWGPQPHRSSCRQCARRWRDLTCCAETMRRADGLRTLSWTAAARQRVGASHRAEAWPRWAQWGGRTSPTRSLSSVERVSKVLGWWPIFRRGSSELPKVSFNTDVWTFNVNTYLEKHT